MTTRTLRFKHLDIKNLWADNVLTRARRYDLTENEWSEDGDGWNIPNPDYAPFSTKEILGRFDLDYPDVLPKREHDEDHEEYHERVVLAANEYALEHMSELGMEPLLSYMWPLGASSYQEGGHKDLRANFSGQPEEIDVEVAQAVLDIYGCNVCLVVIDGQPHLGVTGAGSDFSWDIAEGYHLLGLLPPVDLDLPGGEYRLPRHLRTVAAMRRSYNTCRTWMGHKLGKLRQTQQGLAELPKRK